MAWIRYRIPSGAMATMEAPDEDIPTALRALADNGATVLAVSDDFGRELFDAAAIEQLLVDEYDIAALPWNDPMLASERGDIRPDLTDGGYEQLVIDHLRKIHHANPDALNWVKRQLETLFWRVENSSSRVSE